MCMNVKTCMFSQLPFFNCVCHKNHVLTQNELVTYETQDNWNVTLEDIVATHLTS